jgi:glycosyltransferase involved in cell wall biosynthesis
MLDSLKVQDLGPYRAEIIFVLNNCTDDSERVIRDSGLPCQIISCTEQGCGPARNAALDIAQGEYIWMLDGDDWLLDRRAIRDALDKAKREDLDILRVPFETDKFWGQYFSMVWQYILRRDYIKEFRFLAIQPAEDDAFMQQVLRKAGRSRYDYHRLPSMDRPLYFYNYGREGSNMYRWNRGEHI